MFPLLLRLFATFVAFALVVVPRLASAQAAAEPSRPAIVVAIAEGEPALDPASLRAAIGAELGEDAIAPDDPRAPEGVGMIDVSVDHGAHALVVAYRGATEPITRTVDLPADRAATERAAVLLAGNLARDEADELAASLRKPKEREKEEAAAEAAEAMRALDRLGEALAAYDQENRARETATSVTFWAGVAGAGAGAALVLASIPANNSDVAVTGEYVSAGGTAALVASGFVRPADFHHLYAQYVEERGSMFLNPRNLRGDLERDWGAAARAEHRQRFVRGLLGTILGGGLATAGAILFGEDVRSEGLTAGGGLQLAGAVVGVELATLGIVQLATRGPMESAWQRYERSTGEGVRLLGSERGLSLRPFLAPAQGGGLAGLKGEF
jgi:hypothetical protein